MSLIFLLLLVSPAFAVNQTSSPEQVKIGTYVVNVGSYEINTGSYLIDFYFWLKWDPSSKINPEGFEFMNGRVETKDTIIDQNGYKLYRIQAKLHNSLSLEDYPIDSQNITIVVEDKLITEDKMIYVLDKAESGITENLDLKGWNIVGYDSIISSRNYKNWNESYSNYEFYITIARPTSSIYKLLIPIILIVITSWVIFFVPLKEVGERLFIGGSGLLSAIAFHIYLTGSIPVVGYLTLADKIMISSYLAIVFALASSVYINRQALRSEERAKAINRILTMLDMAVPIVAFLFLSLL